MAVDLLARAAALAPGDADIGGGLAFARAQLAEQAAATPAPASTDEPEGGHPSNADTKSAPASRQQRNQRLKAKKKAKSKETETETTAELQDRRLAAFGEKDFQVSHRR